MSFNAYLCESCFILGHRNDPLSRDSLRVSALIVHCTCYLNLLDKSTKVKYGLCMMIHSTHIMILVLLKPTKRFLVDAPQQIVNDDRVSIRSQTHYC